MKQNIEILLSDWGAWKRGENKSALEYPSRSAFSIMRVDGMRHSDPDVLLVDDDMRRLDRLVDTLFPDAKRAVTAHYVWPGPVKAKLDRVRMSRTRYYDMLDCAHQQLSHWMGGNYAGAPQESISSGHLA